MRPGTTKRVSLGDTSDVPAGQRGFWGSPSHRPHAVVGQQRRLSADALLRRARPHRRSRAAGPHPQAHLRRGGRAGFCWSDTPVLQLTVPRPFQRRGSAVPVRDRNGAVMLLSPRLLTAPCSAGVEAAARARSALPGHLFACRRRRGAAGLLGGAGWIHSIGFKDTPAAAAAVTDSAVHWLCSLPRCHCLLSNSAAQNKHPLPAQTAG